VELNMLFNEGGDEIVRMVVACLHSDVNRVALLSACNFEVFRFELVGQEVVAGALINEDWSMRAIIAFHELARIIGFAGINATEVSFESLNSPLALCWVADWGESGDRREFSWVLQMDAKSSMTSHTMTRDSTFISVNREDILDEDWQFSVNVVIHLVILSPLVSSCVEIETSSTSKII